MLYLLILLAFIAMAGLSAVGIHNRLAAARCALDAGLPAIAGALTSIGNTLAFARPANDAVMACGNLREVFPACLVAGMTGFTREVRF